MKQVGFLWSCIAMICFFFPSTINAQIAIDEDFSDWESTTTSYQDDLNDNNSWGLDLYQLSVANDEDYLYLYIEVTEEINLQDNNNLEIGIDIDQNSTTGISHGGIGAEIVYTFGDRKGLFKNQSSTYTIRHPNIGLITAPTVSSKKFEIAIKRTISVANNNTTLDNDINIALKSGGQDFIPNQGEVFTYSFSNYQSSSSTYEIGRPKTSDLRVLSYNVLFDNLFDTNVQSSFKRVLKAIAPDIIGFQEIYDHSSNQVAQLMDDFIPLENNQQWYHSKVDPDIHAISKYPIIQSEKIQASNFGTGNGAFLIDHPDLDEHILLIVAHPPCCDKNEDRQEEIDAIMAFIRDAKLGDGPMQLNYNSPIIIVGDMNLVGDNHQLETFITGNILDNASYGQDYEPDWNGENLIDSKPMTTGLPMVFTWYDEGSSFNPGRLDFNIYSGSVLDKVNAYSLFTPGLPSDSLLTHGLLSNDVIVNSDHIPVVVDFKFKLKTSTPIEEITQFNCYPNPSSGVLHLQYKNGDDISSIRIKNMQGQEVLRVESEIIEEVIDISFLAQGVYVIELDLNSSRTLRQVFIKQ